MHLSWGVDLTEVHQDHVLILKEVCTLDQLVEVYMTARSGHAQRLAVIEERTFKDEHLASVELGVCVEDLNKGVGGISELKALYFIEEILSRPPSATDLLTG